MEKTNAVRSVALGFVIIASMFVLSPIFASLLCSKKFWAHKINFFEASHLVFNDRFVPSCRIGGT